MADDKSVLSWNGHEYHLAAQIPCPMPGWEDATIYHTLNGQPGLWRDGGWYTRDFSQDKVKDVNNPFLVWVMKPIRKVVVVPANVVYARGR